MGDGVGKNDTFVPDVCSLHRYSFGDCFTHPSSSCPVSTDLNLRPNVAIACHTHTKGYQYYDETIAWTREKRARNSSVYNFGFRAAFCLIKPDMEKSVRPCWFSRLDPGHLKIIHYLMDSVVCFVSTYPLDDDYQLDYFIALWTTGACLLR